MYKNNLWNSLSLVEPDRADGRAAGGESEQTRIRTSANTPIGLTRFGNRLASGIPSSRLSTHWVSIC